MSMTTNAIINITFGRSRNTLFATITATLALRMHVSHGKHCTAFRPSKQVADPKAGNNVDHSCKKTFIP